MDRRIEKTIENLKKNNMGAYYVENRAEALKLIEQLIKKGETVSVGGLVTLNECKVTDFLRNGNYNFLDRYEAGLTGEQISEIFRKSFFCDTYFTSSNAVTETGELVNVDGNSNRIAALAFGPKSVIVLVGRNKLVSDVEAGFKRIKEIAAPLNARRLGRETPCAKTGRCVMADGFMTEGCAGAVRICSNYLVCGKQQTADRIKVIICNEDLGY